MDEKETFVSALLEDETFIRSMEKRRDEIIHLFTLDD
jgi:hypothetical protein